MNDQKVSVVIPVYNGEKTLIDCLNSVLDQTYNNYEVVVVDNNSTDSTKEIIEEFTQKDKRLQYVFEPEQGRGAARNAGIRVAQGEIIAMTDADCIVPRNWIEELTKPIRDGKERAVMGFEKDLINNYWTRNIQRANWEFVQRNLSGNYINHIDTKNFAVETFLLKKIMFNSQFRAMEDFDLYLRLKQFTKIRFIPRLKVRHNYRSSLSGTVENYFNRSYWTTQIHKKHKTNQMNHPMTKSISMKNFIQFPFWMVLQFFKRPPGITFFVLITEVSWRAGIIWALIKK